MNRPDTLGPRTDRRPLLVAGACAAVGVVLSLALHSYFVTTWARYVESVPGYPEAYTRGVPPGPFIAGSPLSMLHGAAFFFVAGAVVSALAGRRYWSLGSQALVYAIGAVHLILLFGPGDGWGNMWPLSVLFTLVLTVLPTFLGTCLTSYVRSLLSKRAL